MLLATIMLEKDKNVQPQPRFAHTQGELFLIINRKKKDLKHYLGEQKAN